MNIFIWGPRLRHGSPQKKRATFERSIMDRQWLSPNTETHQYFRLCFDDDHECCSWHLQEATDLTAGLSELYRTRKPAIQDQTVWILWIASDTGEQAIQSHSVAYAGRIVMIETTLTILMKEQMLDALHPIVCIFFPFWNKYTSQCSDREIDELRFSWSSLSVRAAAFTCYGISRVPHLSFLLFVKNIYLISPTLMRRQ